MKESSRALIRSVQSSIPQSGRLILAFSGGSDSLALLCILSEAARERTEAVYVNHRIRPDEELDAEISLNRRNAGLLGIPFHVIELDKGEVAELAASEKCGTEAAARKLRYSRLEEYRKNNGFDYILTAHHREDQAESIIMRLLDSAPFYSLCGVRERDGNKVRPLLRTSKSDILSLLSDSGLKWSEDSTNSDTDYKRNFIRKRILPMITERERELLSEIAANTAMYIARAGKPVAVSFSYYAEMDRDEFISRGDYAADAAVYRINAEFGNTERVSRKFIESVKEKAREGRGRILSTSMNFYFMKRRIRVYPAVWEFATAYPCRKIGPFIVSDEAEDEKTLLIDHTLLTGSAVLRSSAEGDVIYLKDGPKRVSELEKEYRIPTSIVLEDRNGIAAVFARVFGGRDRLSAGFLGRPGTPVSIRKYTEDI